MDTVLLEFMKGRRIARLSGLSLTESICILLLNPMPVRFNIHLTFNLVHTTHYLLRILGLFHPERYCEGVEKPAALPHQKVRVVTRKTS